MTVAWDHLGTVDPGELVEARQQAHHAVQWVTRLARANLPALADDSQSNLGWDDGHRALLSRRLVGRDGAAWRAGLAIDSMALFVSRGEAIVDRLPLDGRSDAEAGAWLDDVSARVGLHPAGAIQVPYQLPHHAVARGGRYTHRQSPAAFAELARWFAAGDDVLQETRARWSTIVPGPSAVRCWPHHLDIATLLSLAAGNPETAPSIGIGLSPGDDHYAQPYVYLSPWPVPPVGSLPPLPAPGRWHTDGFVSAVVPADALLSLRDRRTALRRFIDEAVEVSRHVLAA